MFGSGKLALRDYNGLAKCYFNICFLTVDLRKVHYLLKLINVFFQIFFNKGAGTCNKVCTKSYDVNKPEDLAKLNFLKKGMGMNYQHHWIVDNMPVRLHLGSLLNIVSFVRPALSD